MACARGKASPDRVTTLRLFADSGGYCQNPTCLQPIFRDIGGDHIHIAEIAHIISAGKSGPRTDVKATDEQKGDYGNLILLCPTCHTVIDKAEEKYPDARIQEWKSRHRDAIAAAFGTVRQPDRASARKALAALFAQNAEVFHKYGPHVEANQNPESDLPVLWRRKIASVLVPNNRKALQILEANREHLLHEELSVVEQFRQHVDDFEAKLLDPSSPSGLQFPPEASTLFS